MKWIKNADIIERTWRGTSFEVGEYRQIPVDEYPRWASDSTLLADIANGKAVVAKDDTGTTDFTDLNDAISYLRGELSTHVSVDEQPPFAKPDFRTKYSATSSKQTVAVNSSQMIDFELVAERYVSGGEIIIKNAQFGDYVTASVVDKNGLYAPAGTVLANYVVKQWV